MFYVDGAKRVSGAAGLHARQPEARKFCGSPRDAQFGPMSLVLEVLERERPDCLCEVSATLELCLPEETRVDHDCSV